MTRFLLLLLVLFIFDSLNIAKANSEETTNSSGNTNNNDDDGGESDSIQVVQRDIVTNTPILTDNRDDILEKDDEKTDSQQEMLRNIDTTEADIKYDQSLDQINNDSTDAVLENPQDNITELSLPSNTTVEVQNDENNNKEFNNNKVNTNQTNANDEQSQADDVNAESNDWRSAEKSDASGEKFSNERNVPRAETSIEGDLEELSTEGYQDKKVSESFELPEPRQPERRSHFGGKFMHAQNFAAHDDHTSIFEQSPMRRFGDVSVPQYRPVLTRGGIVFSPSMYPMQPGTSLLERLTGRSFFPHIPPHINLGHEYFHKQPKPKSRIISVPRYEDSKMMEDYNDYGPNTNTYSYTPVRKVTTQVPPHQIAAPKKFNVFQKLAEASNHPVNNKPMRRSFNDFSSSQIQYPENYGSYGRRMY
ncbi:putative mediator of RNA polymerase II transcription subunit 29 [Spodoptera frugiperda]|uniref:Mediator of RNA polymerase II transcription subunit 29 n=1 Tax=Spodoptera frugiperda TaxID=7108 RepID=A0A9R0DFR5_SPOFR|nr:putative mediator of RNA polymerase II transcription subunit 29 [Spodoptera frugiperda]